MVTIIKRNHHGQESLRYNGEVLERDAHSVCIRAPFGFATRDLGYVLLKQGDWFTEWFYRDRWYNVFMLNDVDTGALKGYYCNFTRPSLISDESIIWDDLALDLWVSPQSATQLLDQDEYDALALSDDIRAQVDTAIAHIQHLVAHRQAPFSALLSTPQAL
jgi:uncharacterized protein